MTNDDRSLVIPMEDMMTNDDQSARKSFIISGKFSQCNVGLLKPAGQWENSGRDSKDNSRSNAWAIKVCVFHVTAEPVCL